ncbi:MAG: hypothetical protein WCG10_06400, partial [Chlamydiota bacterium]
PQGSIQILSKEQKGQRGQWKFQKEKLPPFLIKVLGTLSFMIGGYLLMNLPGVLIGGLLGYQCIKFFCKIFKIKLN